MSWLTDRLKAAEGLLQAADKVAAQVATTGPPPVVRAALQGE